MDIQAEDVRSEEKLIEMVRNRPFLYNKKHADYKDKIKKNNAWSEICTALDRTDAQKLWNDLRRQYTTYLGKLAKPSGSGTGHTPTFRHSLTMSFYQAFYKPYKTTSNLNDEEEDPLNSETNVDGGENLITTSPPGIEVNFEGFDGDTPPVVEIVGGGQTENKTPTAARSRLNKRRRVTEDDVEERLIAALEKTSDNSDELDHFGANVAGRIRKIQTKNPRLANRLQFKIQKVLFDFEECLFEDHNGDSTNNETDD